MDTEASYIVGQTEDFLRGPDLNWSQTAQTSGAAPQWLSPAPLLSSLPWMIDCHGVVNQSVICPTHTMDSITKWAVFELVFFFFVNVLIVLNECLNVYFCGCSTLISHVHFFLFQSELPEAFDTYTEPEILRPPFFVRAIQDNLRRSAANHQFQADSLSSFLCHMLHNIWSVWTVSPFVFNRVLFLEESCATLCVFVKPVLRPQWCSFSSLSLIGDETISCTIKPYFDWSVSQTCLESVTKIWL